MESHYLLMQLVIIFLEFQEPSFSSNLPSSKINIKSNNNSSYLLSTLYLHTFLSHELSDFLSYSPFQPIVLLLISWKIRKQFLKGSNKAFSDLSITVRIYSVFLSIIIDQIFVLFQKPTLLVLPTTPSCLLKDTSSSSITFLLFPAILSTKISFNISAF